MEDWLILNELNKVPPVVNSKAVRNSLLGLSCVGLPEFVTVQIVVQTIYKRGFIKLDYSLYTNFGKEPAQQVLLVCDPAFFAFLQFLPVLDEPVSLTFHCPH